MKRFLDVMLVVSKGMDCVAGAALVLIMLITSTDVVVRYLGHPIPGAYDMVMFGGALVIGFAIPRTSLDRTHIVVDIVTEKLRHGRVLLELITRVLALALFLLLGWNLTKLGASFARTGDGTLTIGLPLYPIAYALGFCAFAQCLVLVADMGRVIHGRRHE
jgi:TRAP-type C4-dicarboxylate transport system permease small subunit